MLEDVPVAPALIREGLGAPLAQAGAVAITPAGEVPASRGALGVEVQALELRVADLPAQRHTIHRGAPRRGDAVDAVGGGARGDAKALGGLPQGGAQLGIGHGGAPTAGGKKATRATG